MSMIDEVMRGLAAKAVRETESSYDIGNAKRDAEKLTKLVDSYDSAVNYEDGDLIEWKPGLRDPSNKFPAYGQPVMCYNLSDEREPYQPEHGRALEYKDLTIAIYFDDIDSVIMFHNDSRRFRKYRPPQEQ